MEDNTPNGMHDGSVDPVMVDKVAEAIVSKVLGKMYVMWVAATVVSLTVTVSFAALRAFDIL